MTKNSNLTKAKSAKNDEFYTQLTDVEKELKHYRQHFAGKTVFCNCDDPTWSAFWMYFHLNFSELGLKKLISTHYSATERTYKMEYTGGDDNNIEAGVKTDLLQNGDFRSEECIELLKEADIVVTNPPFSLFREYVAQLIEYDKKFIIIGNKNCITYKEIFPLIKDNLFWVGAKSMGGSLWFRTPDGFANKSDKVVDGVKLTEVPCCWFTNLDITKRHEILILWKQYMPEEYPKYDNYDVINVDKVAEIPVDYDGVMGVPVTFLDKYNPGQFELIGMAEDNGKGYSGEAACWDGLNPHCVVHGKNMYKRIFIRRKTLCLK